MKKLLRLLVMLFGMSLAGFASAEPVGPFYLKITNGTGCFKLKIYLASDGVSVYGEEMTCSGSRSTLYVSGIGGYYDSGNAKIIVSNHLDTGTIGTTKLGMNQMYRIDLTTNQITIFQALDSGDISASGSNYGVADTTLVSKNATWALSTN